MKRSLNILMTLMLSLMVVYLSVGTTVMHCLRYDKVMVGTVADCCVKRCMDHDCCQGKQGAQVNKHCMDVKEVKLSPTVWNQNVPHSPPRAYLALLNTLII